MSKKEDRSIKRAFTAVTNSYEKEQKNKNNYKTLWEAKSTTQ